MGWLTGRLWIPAVLLRVVAVLVLTIGPWTDQPDDLAGWDVERFQEIAERDGAAWVEVAVEYPPGSVLAIDAIAGESVVSTSRSLAVLAVLAEAVTVLVLWRFAGADAAKAFLVLGLPLVPMGYVRFDLLTVAAATGAALILIRSRSRSEGDQPGSNDRSRFGRSVDAGFGALVVIGAMIKIWPALLIAGAVALRRWSAALWAIGLGTVAGVGWLVLVGDGLEPIDQVLSLRGATGWHVESVPGAIVALVTNTDPRLELNAFRLGTLQPVVVTAGRVLAVILIGLLAGAGAGLLPRRARARADSLGRRLSTRERIGIVMLGSVSALVATAPLLSPQFLLWLTPWVALLAGQLGPNKNETDRALIRLITLGAVAIGLTGATLVVFGPPNLAATAPALLLNLRNLCLLVTPVLCLQLLRRDGSVAGPPVG